jgi:hypothetical protein
MHMKYVLYIYILIQIDQSLLPTVLSLSLIYVRTKDVIIDYIFRIFQFLENLFSLSFYHQTLVILSINSACT